MSVSRAPQAPGILSPRAKSPERNPSSIPPPLMNVPHVIAATGGPNVMPVGSQPPQMVPQMPPHSVGQHGVPSHPIPGTQPPQMLPAKLLEGFEMIKSEFTAISMEATRALYHREETDTKLLQQHIGELNQIRKTVYELDQAHRQMRDKYESEVVKLRQKIDTMRTQPPLAARVAQTNQDGPIQPPLQPLPLPAEKRPKISEEANGAATPLSATPIVPNAVPNAVPNVVPSSAPSSAPNSAPNSANSANSASNSTAPDPSPSLPANPPVPPAGPLPTAVAPSSQVLPIVPSTPGAVNPPISAHVNGHNAPVSAPAPASAPLPGTTSPSAVAAVPNHTVPVSTTPTVPATPLAGPSTVPSAAPFANGEISLIGLDIDQIAEGYKHVGADYTVVYNPQFPPNLEVELVRSLQHTSVVCCVRFSDDGTRLATGCNRSAQIYDVATGELLFQLQDPNVDGTVDLYIRSVCFSPDGKFLATGAEDHKVRIWEIETREIKHVLEGHDQDIYSLMFTTTGRYLVSGSGDRNVKMWDLETGSCFRDFGIEDGVTAVALSPDDRFVAAGSLDKTVRVWDAAANQLVERLDGVDGHEDSVYSVSYRPGHREIVSGSLDKTLKIWELSPPNEAMQGRVRKTLRGHNDYVLSVAVTPDSKWILSGSKDRIVQMWNADTGVVQLMLKAHINSVISVAPSPTGALFASGGGDFTAKVWRYTERPKSE